MWIQRKIEDSMFVENQDFITVLLESTGGRPEKSYIVSIEMAKHLAMMEKTGKAFEVRQYFIEAEKKLQEVVAVEINEITIEVLPDTQHEWLLSTKDVAEGYGLNSNALSMTKSRNTDEFIEGKHFITTLTERDSGKKTMWTKRGVVRLGFFIKTPMAKDFRDWAEDYIIDGSPRVVQEKPALPMTYLEALWKNKKEH